MVFKHVKWLKIIDKAEKRGRFTEANIAEAHSWGCCALGERDKACEGRLKGSTHEFGFVQPLIEFNFSKKAALLGASFFNDAVSQNKFKLARKIMRKIGRLSKKEFYK